MYQEHEFKSCFLGLWCVSHWLKFVLAISPDGRRHLFDKCLIFLDPYNYVQITFFFLLRLKKKIKETRIQTKQMEESVIILILVDVYEKHLYDNRCRKWLERYRRPSILRLSFFTNRVSTIIVRKIYIQCIIIIIITCTIKQFLLRSVYLIR